MQAGISSFLDGVDEIPFALGQFTVHEWMNEIILRNMSEESKKNMTPLKHTTIELTSGIVAGIAAATLSQVQPLIVQY